MASGGRRHRWARAVGALLFVLVLAGCAGQGVSQSGSAATPEEGLPLDPAAQVEYICGAHPFTKDLLSQPANAEQASNPWTAAFRAFLATPSMDIDWLPERGWWLVGVDATTASFIAQVEGDPPFVGVSVANDGTGWRVDSWGQCRPSAVLPGLGPARWTFDPNVPAPSAGDRRFVALVTEMACASGQPADGRILPPVVLYGRDDILVIFGVRPLGGAQNCPGNPATRIVVTLDEPIGDRRVMDGGFLPARDPTEPDPFN
jgi:hypothetical protein